MNMSSNESFYINMAICRDIYMAWMYTYISLLPAFAFVTYIGFTQCKKPRSRSSTTTHSDVFIFNMAALEVIRILGHCLKFLSSLIWDLAKVGDYTTSMASFGQTVFHALVCLERYVAVVHPITYLRLKKNGEVKRNVSIAVVWLFSFAVACLNHFENDMFHIVLIATGVLSLVMISFFCANVLRVLIRPGPGERGGDRKRVDQSKRRAFYTMVAITVALMLKFVPLFVAHMIFLSKDLHNEIKACLGLVCTQWFNIPSSLVMPLLFLYRRHKKRKMNPQ